MLDWLAENAGTIAVLLVLIAVVAAAVFSMIRDKKKGKSCCGSNCAHCACSCSCHKH